MESVVICVLDPLESKVEVKKVGEDEIASTVPAGRRPENGVSELTTSSAEADGILSTWKETNSISMTDTTAKHLQA
jgi:hypothetical protein